MRNKPPVSARLTARLSLAAPVLAAAGAVLLVAPAATAGAPSALAGPYQLTVRAGPLVDTRSASTLPSASGPASGGPPTATLMWAAGTGAPGQPATVTGMVPGDVVATPASAPIAVTASGPVSSTVDLSETVAWSGACPACPPQAGTARDLGQQLVFTVQDVTGATASPGATPSRTLYRGPLIPPAGSRLRLALPGDASSGRWASGETHYYLLSVAMPITLGNDYQGTSASVTFAWHQVPGYPTGSTTVPQPQPGALAWTGTRTAALILLALAAIAAGMALTAWIRTRPDNAARPLVQDGDDP